MALYRRDIDRHEQPADIDASLFPHYLEALHSGRAIDAHNAQRDSRTSELARSYLKPLGIGAILDASIRLGDQAGLLPYSVLVAANGHVLRTQLGPFARGEIDGWARTGPTGR